MHPQGAISSLNLYDNSMNRVPARFSERQQLVIVTTSVAKTPSASLPMDAQFETEEGFWSATGEDAVPNRTITLNDSECREVAAALELMIDHCDAFAAGPADSFSVRRQNCQALLRKLRSATS
jgi:hypothetical protein